MNKIIDDKQCTILWNVDDLNTSHVGPAVVSRVLADIDEEYGNIAKMTIMLGKVHKCLGTTIYYSSPGKLILPMVDYIVNILDAIPEDIKVKSTTPTSHHLLEIAEDAISLSQTNADIFAIFSTTNISFK